MPERLSHAPLRARRHATSLFPAISVTAICHRISRLKIMRRLGLCGSAAAVLLIGAPVGHSEPLTTDRNGVVVAADPFAGFVDEASRRFAIPSSWIRAVMHTESLGEARAVSPKGAMGLMQIMPATWAELRRRYGLGEDPYDPHDNIIAGAAYLRELHDRYGKGGFLAAYNAGPGRYEDYLATGRPLPSETLAYASAVASVIGMGTEEARHVGTATASSWTSAPLFVSRMATGSMLSRPPSGGPMQSVQADGAVQGRTALAPVSDGLFTKAPGRNARP